jgi:hypothetical protein
MVPTSDNGTENHDDFDHVSGLLKFLSPGRKICTVFDERAELQTYLEVFDPIASAALLAGLLTEPSFLANTLRLELSVHLFLGYARGSRKPNRRELQHLLNEELGATFFALMEDPPEDVFVSNVTTAAGNFRIFEGIWESSDFYLQRVLNIIETLPDDEKVYQLRREVFAILKVSEEIARRRHLARYTSGNGSAKQAIQLPGSKQMKTISRSIMFSAEDLERLKIQPEELEPFVFPSEVTSRLGTQILGDSDVERRPISRHDAIWYVVLPTAISLPCDAIF